jgi:hypothetical protein
MDQSASEREMMDAMIPRKVKVRSLKNEFSRDGWGEMAVAVIGLMFTISGREDSLCDNFELSGFRAVLIIFL